MAKLTDDSTVGVTPMMRQYDEVKAQYGDALVLFRMGDFYETFNEDAVKASEILGITLTKRANGGAANMDLAGFPYHALDTYLPKLVRAGLRVAICDQLEDPKLTKKLVKRGVTEVITPGVALDDNVLSRRENNYLAAVCQRNGQIGAAFIDVSTGEYYVSQGDAVYVDKLFTNFRPKEVLISRGQTEWFKETFDTTQYTTRLDDWAFTLIDATRRLQEHFGTQGLRGFGIEEMHASICAAGAVLAYLNLTKHENLSHVVGISRIDSDQYVWLDRFTLRNLEVFEPVSSNGRTLVETIDATLTPMGSRLLRRWLALPLRDIGRIADRHEAVRHFVEHGEQLEALRELLREFGDLERLSSRAAMQKIIPREAWRLGRSLALLAPLRACCLNSGNATLRRLGEQINPLKELSERLSKALVEEPSSLGKDGVFASGVSLELDECRAIRQDSRKLLDDLQMREAMRTGITSLKIGFNNVFGYYYEVRNTHKDKVPQDWLRKQTLSQAERYIDEELKRLEEKIVGAEARMVSLEEELYANLLAEIGQYVVSIQLDATLVAQLDVLSTYAKTAVDKGWVKPEMRDDFVLDINNGWHPVIVEMLPSGEDYVRNSVYLDDTQQQIMMITGPNMSGKSALLRQTALIVLLAQAGSFVPAEGASIGVVDKIFTRVGASDNISAGESTFMVEMSEAASILNNLSARSLILLDEIGRGTSTYDGISIAWAMAEYIHDSSVGRAKTLFATHYHELNEMESLYERIRNYSVSVREIDGKIIFLRKLIPGGSEHSFGLHVAKLAGMPPRVVQRASEILKSLEAQRETNGSSRGLDSSVGRMSLSVFQLEDPELKRLRDRIAAIDVNNLTPVAALVALSEIKEVAGL